MGRFTVSTLNNGNCMRCGVELQSGQLFLCDNCRNMHKEYEANKDRLKKLCERRINVAKTPWNPKDKNSLNAKVEVAMLDDLIVELVLTMYEKFWKEVAGNG